MMFMPTKIQQHSNAKTDGELYYHNDRTAHPFLSLLGMRCSEENLILPATDGKAILDNLKAESREWLRKPLFITPFDEYSRLERQPD